MNGCQECCYCGAPGGTLAASPEVAPVACNVREFAGETFTVWRCAACASLHCKEPMDPERYYARYPMKRQRLDFPTRVAFAKRLAWLVDAGLRPGASVLDVGCGTGLFVEFLRARGYAARGYDPHVVAYANPDVLERRYDAVTAQDVLEHVEEPARVFQSWVDRVAPGGILHVGTPRAEALSPAESPHHPSLHQPYHRHIPSERALALLAGAAKLRVAAARRRWYFDSWLPGLNERFLHRYLGRLGGYVDDWFAPPRPLAVMTSPSLTLDFFFGGLRRQSAELSIYFHKPADESALSVLS